jgi:lipopolysaccharide transport system ATP-binding protein
MANDIIINIDSVYKSYQLGVFNLKSLINKREFEKNKIEALKNINLEICRSDRVGIIGKNASGKSTLLKIISGVTYPTKGNIEIYGKVSSALEAGAGFNPELTGYDNIFLNGAILGINYKLIKSKINDIINFSELQSFINTPVKRYSSGMIIRLAFAIISNLDGDIMILDEILSVADEDFRIKCVNKIIDDCKINNRTLLFVSHDIRNVQEVCNKIIYLKNGMVEFYGCIKDGIKQYNLDISKNY